MLEFLRLHPPDSGRLVAGLAGVAIAAFSAMAEPVSAQLPEGQAEFGKAPELAAPPSTGTSSSSEGEGIARFDVMANMVTLTEVVSSNVALLSGTTWCDAHADLAYNGTIENNIWNVRLTGTYADRLVTLDHNGTVSSAHHMGRFEGSGAFGDEAWSSSGLVAFSPDGEFMSLAGSVEIEAATPVWRWDANWLMSEGDETDSANAINVFKQQNRPLIIIVIQGTWRHTTYWLHSVIIDIVFFNTATGQKGACQVNIQESGEQTTKGHFRVNGLLTVKQASSE